LVSVVELGVSDEEKLEYEESEANKDESEDLTTSVGYNETIVDVLSTLLGCSSVSVDSNSHADVS
jgi:hypothetical protein